MMKKNKEKSIHEKLEKIESESADCEKELNE